MQSTIRQLGLSAALTVLCIVLTGCADLTSSIGNAMAPQGMMVGSGTVTAVNAADRTVEVKTDRGDTMVLSITDSTSLEKCTYSPILFGNNSKAITCAEIGVGKYLEFTCNKEAEDGKHATARAQMFDSKFAAENY
jgi:hypothetical protein